MSNKVTENKSDEIGSSEASPRPTKIIIFAAAACIVLLLAVFLLFSGDSSPFSGMDWLPFGSKDTTATAPDGSNDNNPGNANYEPEVDISDIEHNAQGEVLLPEGVTPDEWVNDFYYELISKQYVAAWKRLPSSLRSNQRPSQFTSQMDSDPVISVKSEGSPDVSKRSDAVVTTDIVTRDGTRNSTQIWTFEKEGSRWVLLSRITKGMPQ
jgi:hypothetical protein